MGRLKITWVGVPEDAKKDLRAEIARCGGSTRTEHLVCSERAADRKVRASIRESLWAFNSDFIARHATCRLNDTAIAAIKKMQETLCEDANEIIFGMIRDFKEFVREAVSADGRGHFLSSYDGNETEVRVNGESYYIYLN